MQISLCDIDGILLVPLCPSLQPYPMAYSRLRVVRTNVSHLAVVTKLRTLLRTWLRLSVLVEQALS